MARLDLKVPGFQSSKVPGFFLLALVAAGVAFRVVELGRLPGISGDEAWYGVNVQAFLAGDTPFWRTGVGNPLNPLHSGPLLLLSLVAEPSFALLRAPEVLLGSLAIILAYPLLAKPLGPRPALYAAALLAVSPMAVAYARIGWDPSGTPFIALLAIGFALRDRPIISLLCWLTALVVHPTNIFLAPIVVTAWAPHAIDRYLLATDQTRQRLLIGLGVTVVLATPIALWILKGVSENPNTVLPSVEMVLDRTLSPRQWLNVVWGVMGLFSGVTAAASIAGPIGLPARATANALAAASLAVPIIVGWRAFRSAGNRRGLWLLVGVGVSLVVFHVIAVPGALQPGRERYALFLITPLTILCALGLGATAETYPRLATTVLALTLASSVTVLTGGYVVPLATVGGNSDPAWRTGSVEPKAAAYAFVEADSRGVEQVAVVAEDWWLYWPLRYLATHDRRIHVELMAGAPAPGGLFPQGFSAPTYARAPDKEYAVVFEGGAAWARLQSEGRAAAFTAVDPSGRPILHVVALPSTTGGGKPSG